MARTGCGAVVQGDNLYVIGGFYPDAGGVTELEWAPIDDGGLAGPFQVIGQLPVGVGSAEIVEYGGLVYVYGGVKDNNLQREANQVEILAFDGGSVLSASVETYTDELLWREYGTAFSTASGALIVGGKGLTPPSELNQDGGTIYSYLTRNEIIRLDFVDDGGVVPQSIGIFGERVQWAAGTVLPGEVPWLSGGSSDYPSPPYTHYSSNWLGEPDAGFSLTNPLPSNRNQHCSFAYGSHAYVAGGQSGTLLSDVVVGDWDGSALTNFRSAGTLGATRENCACVVIGANVYVIGGDSPVTGSVIVSPLSP